MADEADNLVLRRPRAIRAERPDPSRRFPVPAGIAAEGRLPRIAARGGRVNLRRRRRALEDARP